MEHIPGYDERKTTEPEKPAPKLYCTSCGEGIYEGEPYFEIAGETLCVECTASEYKKYA